MPRLSFYLRATLPLLALLTFPGAVRAEIWEIRPQVSLPGVDGVAQKVELLDFDADGYVDIVFVNSRGDSTGSEADAQLSQLLRNEAGMGFTRPFRTGRKCCSSFESTLNSKWKEPTPSTRSCEGKNPHHLLAESNAYRARL